QETKGRVEEIRSKHRYRMWDSISRWEELFPGVPFLMGIRLSRKEEGPFDFGPVLRALEQQDRDEATVRSWYRETPVGALMLTRATGRDTIQTVLFLASVRDLPIRCSRGTAPDLDAGREVTAGAKALVVDPTALATLLFTGL